MADKQMQKGKYNQPNPRQIGIGIAFVVVIIILVWQVWGIFGASTPTPPPLKPTTSATAAAATAPLGAAATHVPAEEPVELARGKITNEPSFIKMQQMTEEKYVTKLNELEELRIQRQIAETNQAIAAAKLATVTAEKDISDLLTRPLAPQVPASDYAAQLVSPTTTGGNVVPVETAPPAPIADYTLISVSMQLNRWNAVVGLQGKLFTVGIGDVLPDDSKVANINRNSIILKKQGETRKITIVSSI